VSENKEKITIELWFKGKHGREEKPRTRRKLDERTKRKSLARWAISRLEREGLSLKDIVAIDPDQLRIYVKLQGRLVPYWDEKARDGDSDKSVSGIGKRRLEALLAEYPEIKDARKLTQEEWVYDKELAVREGYKRLLEHIFR
jgi:hypothetical protein